MICFFGFPSHSDRDHLRKTINDILLVQNWPSLYKQCGLKVPTPTEMTNRLKNSVKYSLKKKYHTKNTDFTRIQGSGVSKILLKGESFTCNTNIKKVYLEEIWGYPENTLFLDASCLIYDFNKKNIGTVDYSRRRFPTTATDDSKASIFHSGDVIAREKKEGKHTINVFIEKLPNNVSSLYFTFTGYTTPIREILHPYILFTDPDTNQQLCQYQFDNKDTGDNTAVIMAKLFRQTPTSQWTVIAIGHIGMGRVHMYEAILEDIAKKNL